MRNPSDATHQLGDMHAEVDLINILVEMQDKVHFDTKSVKLLTLIRHNAMVFRGSTSFGEIVWRNWVAADWGEGFEKQTSPIGNFVDLSSVVSVGSRITIGALSSVDNLQPAVHVVVESNKHVKNLTSAELIPEIEIAVHGFAACLGGTHP